MRMSRFPLPSSTVEFPPRVAQLPIGMQIQLLAAVGELS